MHLFLPNKSIGDSKEFEDWMRDHEQPPGAFIDRESEINELQRLYQNTVFHGTGRFNHNYKNRDKEQPDEGITDTLESILTDGLLTQRDIVLKILYPEYEKSTSVTRNRQYARCYAEMFTHGGPDSALDYRFGSRALWWNEYLNRLKYVVYRKEFSKVVHLFLSKLLCSKKARKAAMEAVKQRRHIMSNWLMNATKEKRGNLEISQLTSDIPDNYPVLMGFEKSDLEFVDVLDTLKIFEERTIYDITADKIKFIEVPGRNIQETRQLLASLGLNIPLFSMELGEVISWKNGFNQCMESHIQLGI